ncbi:MAG TPA: type II toxin-antitoxin system RelE/ParE family toxin [Hyphomicrobiaceae bacterium]|jgi:plasmid stabilization system protein ParE
MRRWVLDPQAEADLQEQLDYPIDRGAVDAAERLSERVKAFLRDFLTAYPATGVFLGHRGLWETWIPRTRLVLWYRFTDSELQVARIWHTSRNRRKAPR